MNRRYSQLLVIIGVMLFFFGTVYPLEIYNTITIDTCDTTTANTWSVHGGSTTATISIDTLDKVEGLGSIRYDVSSGYMLYAKVRIFDSHRDLSSTPVIRFRVKASMTMPFDFQIDNNIGLYSYDDTYTIGDLQGDEWQTYEINLQNSDSGTPDLSSIVSLIFVFNAYGSSNMAGENAKIDFIEAGTASSEPTPSPSPTPTATPTPSPTPTPTPAPNEFQVSITPSDTTNLLVGENKIFTATVLNGEQPYTYQWYVNDTQVDQGEGAYVYDTGALIAGTYQIYVRVTDNQQQVAASNIATLIVSTEPSQPTPSPSPAPSSPIVFPLNYLQIAGLGCIGAGSVDLLRRKWKE